MIRIGNEIIVDVGETVDEVFVTFRGMAVGGITRLALTFDSETKQMPVIEMVRTKTLEPNPDFLMAMKQAGIHAKIVNLD